MSAPRPITRVELRAVLQRLGDLTTKIDAVLADDRLPEPFLTIRLPQMREKLGARRGAPR